MFNLKNISIKNKLVAIQLLTSFIVLLLYSIFLIINDMSAYKKSVIRQMTSMAQFISANSVSAINFLDNEFAKEILSSLDAEKEIVNAWIYDSKGLFAKYSKEGYSQFDYPYISEVSNTSHGDFITLTEHIMQEGEKIGTVSLRINMDRFTRIFQNIVAIALVALLGGLAIAFLLSLHTQKTISTPVIHLADTAKHVSQSGDYTLRCKKDGDDEVGVLCETFNNMMDQIEHREIERDKAEETLKSKNQELEQEIKERKKAEYALRESESKFRTLASNIPGAVYRCANDENWTMDFISDPIKEISGYAASDFLQNKVRSYASIIHPDDQQLVNAVVQKALAERKPYIIDYQIVKVDGTVRWVYEKGQGIFNENDDLKWLDGVIFDITERKQAEQLLTNYNIILEKRVNQRTSELEKVNAELNKTVTELREVQQQLVLREKMASLGNLVAGVAHEVNNPIGAVNSAADVTKRSIQVITDIVTNIKSVADIKNNSRFQSALKILYDNNEVILSGGRRIAQLVQSLKNFSRIDESDLKIAHIHEGLDSTLILIHHLLKNKIKIIKDYGDIPSIRCQPNQLNQVFMNVLVNATHAIKNEGTITIKTNTENDFISIIISDTGEGIPPQNLDKIFDPGFTTKGVGIGTGLGLSISYRIIENHKGKIQVKSQVNKGTEFKITLPKTLDKKI